MATTGRLATNKKQNKPLQTCKESLAYMYFSYKLRSNQNLPPYIALISN